MARGRSIAPRSEAATGRALVSSARGCNVCTARDHPASLFSGGPCGPVSSSLRTISAYLAWSAAALTWTFTCTGTPPPISRSKASSLAVCDSGCLHRGDSHHRQVLPCARLRFRRRCQRSAPAGYERGDEQIKKASAKKRLLSLQELFDFGLGFGEIPRNSRGFESVRYYARGIPHRIPAGRVLVHNHVQHKVDTVCGERGFRAWTQMLSDRLQPCKCGWSGLPHYRVRRRPKR
jgi:hypothetical protein